MSSRTGRRVSREDIQLVKNLIERCLQLYMNQKEVVKMLVEDAKIEPGFTEIVWKKLEEENQEFFKAYYVKLVLKQQIIEFNRLLEQQSELMCQIQPTERAPKLGSDGSHIMASHQNAASYTAHNRAGQKQENMFHPVGSSNVYSNGVSSLHSSMHSAVDMAGNSNRIDSPPNIFSNQNSITGLIQGMNGSMIKSEAGFPDNSLYMFGRDGNIVGTHTAIRDASVASFNSMDPNSHSVNEPLPDAGTCYGLLDQLPQKFSFADLTFSQSSDICAYDRSPFIGTDNEGFLDSCSGEQDNKKLDSIPEEGL